MPNFDFFDQPSLPRPEVTIADAVTIAAEHFGLIGAITELGSQQDRNFLLDTGIRLVRPRRGRTPSRPRRNTHTTRWLFRPCAGALFHPAPAHRTRLAPPLVRCRAQSHLDMVNNVTQIGHGHPRLVEAVRDQWAKLNTNSRFHYEELSRYTERLAALAPEGLDTVFLVNSGSEAVDLALRLAQTHTGRRTVLALQEEYHGWTLGSDAVSSSVSDNPRALETRPDWVRLVAAPHTLRGRHRGPDAAAAYLADLDAELDSLQAQGVDIAGYIAEPVFGNAGGLMLPDGYLAGVYDRVRARGGICIADEVQVGFGRLGHFFWGSQQQGVVPDIITVAKAVGNGHPLGAVITRHTIAESFAAEGSFFSSAGGSPVSSVVGATVLDVMRDEGLQQNAIDVGDHLTARLRKLGDHHPVIGAVHGMGLYLGVELVLDRETMTPATIETNLVCDRMLTEGVIVQPTGDYKNVLKIKPPLCITQESADRFVDALDLILATL